LTQHLFILGPSGAGKSAVAAAVGSECGLSHLEIDRYPEGDGIDMERLRPEWDEFLKTSRPEALAEQLSRRAARDNTPGCVLSFPSGLILSVDLIVAAETAGIRVRYLYGSAAACMIGFLEREKSTGRGLGVEHWLANNASSYLQLSRPEYAPYRVEAFTWKEVRVPLDIMVQRVGAG
jgi:hypothetical protein